MNIEVDRKHHVKSRHQKIHSYDPSHLFIERCLLFQNNTHILYDHPFQTQKRVEVEKHEFVEFISLESGYGVGIQETISKPFKYQ